MSGRVPSHSHNPLACCASGRAPAPHAPGAGPLTQLPCHGTPAPPSSPSFFPMAAHPAQGSCSTCAQSQATMKMGIERALQLAFGDQLKDVIQVGPRGGRIKGVIRVLCHVQDM